MDLKSLGLGVAAALMFAVGGICMKPAAGLSRPWPTAAMVGLFVGGAGLNALVVHRQGEVGTAYLMVIGCETLLAYVFGVVLFSERVTAPRLAAVGLILVGTLLLVRPDRAAVATPPGQPLAAVQSPPAGGHRNLPTRSCPLADTPSRCVAGGEGCPASLQSPVAKCA